MLKFDEIADKESCWNKAGGSERVFVLLARDPAAPAAIRAWLAKRVRLGKNVEGDDQYMEALDCADQMETERDEVIAGLPTSFRRGFQETDDTMQDRNGDKWTKESWERAASAGAGTTEEM